MKVVGTKAVLALGMCLLLVPDGPSVLAGFSDGLVGKGKAPATPQASQAPTARPPSENASIQKEAEVKELSVPQAAGGIGNRVVLGSFDVVGLRLGMTQEEAIGIIKRRTSSLNGKPTSFEMVKEGKHQVLVQGAVPQTRFVTLSDAKSVLNAFELSEDQTKNPSNAQDPRIQQFAANGQIEVFGFQFPNVPNEPRVSGITRVQRLAPPVHIDTIRTALIQKYGPPSFDDKIVLVWLLGPTGGPLATQDLAKCRGVVLPPGASAGEYDYSLAAMKGCGEQLTVQLQGTPEAVMLIQTTLYHHQRLVDEREATQHAALSRFGLAPEQTKKAPAPQF